MDESAREERKCRNDESRRTWGEAEAPAVEVIVNRK
jgi:hypothetical protein